MRRRGVGKTSDGVRRLHMPERGESWRLLALLSAVAQTERFRGQGG